MKRTVLITLALAWTPAAADDHSTLLDQAQQAIDDIDHEAAGRLATAALATGDLDAKQLGRAYRLAGESAAALGDTTVARAHFVRWIVLDPAAALPPGSSPKIGQPFAEARAEADEIGRFSVDVAVTRGRDRIEITLSAHDPLGLVTGMRLRLGDSSEVGVSGSRAVLQTADASSVAVEVTVVDEHGNELSRRTVAGDARGAQVGDQRPDPRRAPGATPRRRGWPTIVRWPTWTGLAVVTAGAGGFFAWQVGQTEDELAVLNAASDQHSFDEAEAVRDRGQRQALFANIGLGVAGAAGLAAVLALALEPGAAVEITPTPTAGGATISAAIRF